MRNKWKLWIANCCFICFFIFMNQVVIAVSPLDDAIAVWHFDNLNDVNGENSRLSIHGDVHLGISMATADEIEESKIRGGDGKFVRFGNNSYLSADLGAQNELKIDGQELTICLRLRDPSGKWDCPVFSKHGGHEILEYNIFCIGGYLGAEVGTTENKNILSGKAHFSEMRNPQTAPTDWHDLVCRVNSAKLELFVDGRCVDEDFVLGELRISDIPLLIGGQYDTATQARGGFRGDLDHAAIWNRALSDDEIVELSGGSGKIDSRQRTDRGNGESLQYWQPPNQYGVGDCMPFCVDGVFHFMYLLDKNHHSAKNGLGAHQWIQATSTDLIHWEHQPFVVPIDNQNEGSICTGSVFYHDGIYYAFYANRAVQFRTPDGQEHQTFGLICVSTSKDGIHFEKEGYEPLFLLPEGYGSGTRDPVVFQDPETKLFHMYITNDYYGKGCWAQAVSEDLKSWNVVDPVYTPYSGQPECPDWFKWGDQYYLIANHLNGFYLVSDSATGPWIVPDKPNILMPGIVNVPKTAPFKDGRRIICAWSREHGFGGHAVFHELIRYEDGTLGEKFVPEMIPQTELPVVDEKNIRNLDQKWSDLPGEMRVQIELDFDANQQNCLRDWSLKYDAERSIRVVFSERAVYLNQFKLERVDMSDGKIELDIIIKDDLIDLCVNHCRAVIDTLPKMKTRELLMKNESFDKMNVSSLKISPLIP
ncbi:MAG: LamG-like jellyroll fold domain-containing protein [Planctomycetia bacterium]|nr:LamG-like jellyroll fold domain-containing protein [Planctomycetia bacterium]